MSVGRIKRADLKELLVSTGITVLLEEGVRPGLHHLTFPKVFERIEHDVGRRVTRASVYDRIWTSQEDYQWDVLAHLIAGATIPEGETLDEVRAALDSTDCTTPEARTEGLVKVCQLAIERHVADSAKRANFRIIATAAGAISSASDAEELSPIETRVRDALGAYLEHETDVLLELYSLINARLGFRLRSPLEPRHLVLAIEALSDGIAMRSGYFPDYLEPIDLPSEGAGTEPVVGTLAGIGVRALTTTMLELDPDWS